VALLAQVSVSTASRALSGGHYVAPPVRERVRAAATHVGYQPNEAARGLRTTRTMTIAVLTVGLRTLPFLDFLDGFGAHAEAAEYTVLLANARNSEQQYRFLVGRLFERRVDGLLLVNPGELHEAARPFQETARPVLAAFGRGPSNASIPLVTTAELDAVRQGMHRLKSLGHTSIAYFDQAVALQSSRPGYVARAAAECGIACRVAMTDPDADGGVIRHNLVNALAAPTPVTAVAVTHGLVPQFIDAVRSLGLKIPGDLSVFTFSDSALIDPLIEPRLAAVHNDLVEMGGRTAKILIDWICDGVEPANVTDLGLSSWREMPSLGWSRLSGG
jgi:LacI family transcriptional regulator